MRYSSLPLQSVRQNFPLKPTLPKKWKNSENLWLSIQDSLDSMPARDNIPMRLAEGFFIFESPDGLGVPDNVWVPVQEHPVSEAMKVFLKEIFRIS